MADSDNIKPVMTDPRMDVAAKAVGFIMKGNIVGLGASGTIQHMIYLLAAEIKKGWNIQLVTSSFTTQQLLLQQRLRVQPISNFTNIDIYFDGCDQFDKNLHALKSGGGIHTHEKLLAAMASQFILLGDETKYVSSFDQKYPLVIEYLPEAIHYLPAYLEKIFPGIQTNTRLRDKRQGPAITSNGNFLMDIKFSGWPALADINPLIKSITGVVETSLFYNMAHKAIISVQDEIKIIEKV
jgi:ribose 5-phosphate isomerase A